MNNQFENNFNSENTFNMRFSSIHGMFNTFIEILYSRFLPNINDRYYYRVLLVLIILVCTKRFFVQGIPI